MTVYYAVRYKRNGAYWHRKTSPTPALFTSEAMAHSTLKKNTRITPDEYEIVKFQEVK